MPAADAREDEASSLRALRALGVLDSDPEPEFDALVKVAALVCGVPISLISLVDSDRQWFKANVGLPGVRETPRDVAFCAHAVLGDGILEVQDTTQDPRFRDNPLVTGTPDIRFYAGAPVQLDDGSRIGTLCVIDRKPGRLDERQREVLTQLAVAASRALQGRRATAEVRQTARELTASESRFRVLSEGSPLGVYATDAQGACTYVNPRWQEIFGLKGEDALGTGWTRSLHPLDRDAVFATWLAAALQQREFDMEFRILRPDHSERVVRSRARSVLSPELDMLGFIGSVDDVTDRKKVEAFLDRTGRVAGVGGWEVDLRTNTLTWSDQTRRIHELPPGFVPNVETALAFYAEDARPAIAAAMQAGTDEGKAWDMELPLITAQGRSIWVRTQGDVEFDDHRPVRLIGAIQDITEQRSRRLELQQEQSLRSQLEAQMRQTEELLRERSEMLDVMAHEIRQPLNNASAAMQSAALALAGLQEPLATPRLARAQTVLAQVLANIDNTLAVAALLARQDPIARADTDLDALMHVVVADISQPQRGRIRIERSTATRTASMDMSLIRLAIRNLLNNALQFSPQDAPVVIRLSDSDDPLAVLIDVADAGTGIADALVLRLFERGIHQGRRRAEPGQGHGLGLYIVRRVMELHGGSVRLHANGPRGSTMRLIVNQSHGD